MHTPNQALWTAHLQNGCGEWLTLEAPCRLTTIPDITVDNSPESEIEVDADISSAPESAMIKPVLHLHALTHIWAEITDLMIGSSKLHFCEGEIE